MLRLLPLLLLLLPELALAQVVSAWASAPQIRASAYHESMALDDGGLIMVHELENGRFLIERRGENLQTLWADEASLPPLPELGMENHWFGVFQNDLLYSLKPAQVLSRLLVVSQCITIDLPTSDESGGRLHLIYCMKCTEHAAHGL